MSIRMIFKNLITLIEIMRLFIKLNNKYNQIRIYIKRVN